MDEFRGMRFIRHGIRPNLGLFLTLMGINALVGALAGTERTVFPALADMRFGVTDYAVAVSFIASFGLAKAAANLFSASLFQRMSRKRVLLLGWMIALPAPLLMLWAPHWWILVAANLLIGFSQGLTWTSAVVMKMDVAGPLQRGVAMGLNEFAGYLALGLTAFFTGWMGSHGGVYPFPLYLATLIIAVGIVWTWIGVCDTKEWMEQEIPEQQTTQTSVFRAVSGGDWELTTITQAGFVNNLNDGVVWGLLPVLAVHHGYSLGEAGWLAAIYPAVWGIAQLFTGWMADRFSSRALITTGMLLQGIALIGIPRSVSRFELMIFFLVLLGIGTALVYPTFLAQISQRLSPKQRAEGLSYFRFWRDLGYVVGVLFTFILLDYLFISSVFEVVGVVTIVSGGLVFMPFRR